MSGGLFLLGPVVLLLHGFPSLWYMWRKQMAALAEAGFRAVAPDQRGYGQTDVPDAVEDYTFLHLVGDIVGLLDALGEQQVCTILPTILPQQISCVNNPRVTQILNWKQEHLLPLI